MAEIPQEGHLVLGEGRGLALLLETELLVHEAEEWLCDCENVHEDVVDEETVLPPGFECVDHELRGGEVEGAGRGREEAEWGGSYLATDCRQGLALRQSSLMKAGRLAWWASLRSSLRRRK